MIIDEIWATWTDPNPDFDEQDRRNDARKVYLCQSACHEFLYNGLSEDEYLDHLIAYGVNPDEYIKEVQRQSEWVLKQAVPLEDLWFATHDMGIFR